MSNVRNETGEVTTDTAEAQKPWEKYYEHVFTNKEDNLTEMDKFLETHSLPRPTHEEIENPNKLITSNKIESAIKNLPIIKRSGPDGVIGEFYQIKRILVSSKLFRKIKNKWTLPNSFY